jgi:pimeloyl-ACP methyl ester carboxylesterase
VLKYVGKAITPISSRLPVGPRAIAVISHTGFMFPVSDKHLAARAVREFLTTPVDWYFHLALSTSRHARVSLSKVHVPALFVAATYDVLAGTRDMASAARRLEQGEYVELRGSHFIAMEQPERVHELLLDFLERIA